jgi:hypothetical protein
MGHERLGGKLQVQPCPQCPLATVGPKKAVRREGHVPTMPIRATRMFMMVVARHSLQ